MRLYFFIIINYCKTPQKPESPDAKKPPLAGWLLVSEARPGYLKMSNDSS
jgi:hypothetical protein